MTSLEELAFFKAILEDADTSLVYADWLEEQGRLGESSQIRLFPWYDSVGFSDGHGSYGGGDGNGYGDGYDCDGYGSGYGYGNGYNGSGYGNGYGYGDGDGYGDGNGDGYGSGYGYGGNGYGLR